MADYCIDCVHKPNRMSPHEHITDAGGPKPDGGRWQDTVENVVRFIEKKQHRFDTQKVIRGLGSPCERADGSEVHPDHADRIWNDNLLALKECPT
ncbi:DUF3892 domain-containing protein [Bradyrhizobium diazoefficiens]|nr:DUF3892 domain-containing protein [Bradyrhizobium diazoefficiens]MBK3662555.1 DUF3892 domain-containing protein [Bradyrhizobium diazoefficiens]